MRHGDRLIEVMHEVKTELLQAFGAVAEAHEIRLEKIEADQSNLNAALSGRMDILESRLVQIELKLGVTH